MGLQSFSGLQLSVPDEFLIAQMVGGLIALMVAIALRRYKLALRPAGFTLLAVGLFAGGVASLFSGMARLRTSLDALGLILALWALILISLDLVEARVRRHRRHFSTIFKDLLMVLGCALVLAVVLRAKLQVDIEPLVASGAVVTVVVGLALQETLGNIFSGLSLQLEKSFTPGDWVRSANQEGRVLGIGWRSTTVLTRANERLHIPNAMIAKDLITNYTAEGGVADEVVFAISYLEPPNRVREVIQRALLDVPDIAREPAPEVLTWEYCDNGIKYKVKYWLRDYGLREQVHDWVCSALWYVLRRNAMEIPYPVRMLQFRRTRREREGERTFEAGLVTQLRQVDFLRELGEEELQMLASTALIREFGAGEVVVRQGDSAESFFIIRRGTVEVLAEAGNGQQAHIAELGPAAFFGEIALMTGERRNAKVIARTDVEVLEIDRDAFTRLFHNHPEVTARIGEVIAARLSERRDILEAMPGTDGGRARRNWLLEKMRAVFNL